MTTTRSPLVSANVEIARSRCGRRAGAGGGCGLAHAIRNAIRTTRTSTSPTIATAGIIRTHLTLADLFGTTRDPAIVETEYARSTMGMDADTRQIVQAF